MGDTLDILFEDNHLLVVDKPAGLLVQGGDRATRDADNHLVARVAAWLKAKYDKPRNVYVGLVHRLDRNTSGVVVLARTSKAAERLSRAFATRAVEKTYLAVTTGHTPPRGTLDHWLVPPRRPPPGPPATAAPLVSRVSATPNTPCSTSRRSPTATAPTSSRCA